MREDRGMTLIEVMIAMAILAIMVAFVFLVVHNGVREAERTSTTNELSGRGREALDEVRRLVQYSRVLQIGATFTVPDTHDHAAVRFQVHGAIDANADGDVDGYEYGWYDMTVVDNKATPLNESFMPGWSAEIYFEATDVLQESSGSPAVTVPSLPTIPAGTTVTLENRDLNRDGDMTDTFVRGHLWVRTWSCAPPPAPTLPLLYVTTASASGGGYAYEGRRVLDDYVVLAVDAAGFLKGDINNDGTGDKLFSFYNDVGMEILNSLATSNRRVLRMNVWHGAFDDRHERLMLRQNTEDVRLESPQ